MDDAGCHPEHLQGKFSNILQVCFLPANTTSKFQPLDLGIIKTQVHYCSYFLRHILAKIDECSCASEVVKIFNILEQCVFGSLRIIRLEVVMG